MNDNTVTKIGGSTVIGSAVAGVPTAMPSALTDATKITEDTVNKVLRLFSTKTMTLADKGLQMRIALATAFFNINPTRKEAKLTPLKLEKNALDTTTIAKILNDHFIIRKVVHDVNNLKEIAVSDIYKYNDPSASIPMSSPYTNIAGIYTPITDDDLMKIAMEVEPGVGTKAIADIKLKLRAMANVIELDKNPDHSPVNNGIFDYCKQELIPFSPDIAVTKKILVDYDEDAPNVLLKVYHYDDKVVEYRCNNIIDNLSNFDYTRDIIYRVTGACFRPYVAWKKCVWMYGHSGSNGKSMLKNLICDMVGSAYTAEMDLDDYSGKKYQFSLESMYDKHVLITSDSNKKDYMEALGNLKKLTGDDKIKIDRKFKGATEYSFHGVILMLMNSMPGTKHEIALDRRIAKIDFDKTFVANAVDPACRLDPQIMDDFIHRPEVHRWLLKHVLHDLPPYYTLETPTETSNALDQAYREDQNIVMRFLKTSRLLEFMGAEDASASRAIGMATGENVAANRVMFPIGRQLLFDIFQRWCELENEQTKGGFTCNNFIKEFSTTLEDYPYIAPIEIIHDSRDRIYAHHKSDDLVNLSDKLAEYFRDSKIKYGNEWKNNTFTTKGIVFGLTAGKQERFYIRVKVENSNDVTE